MSIRGLSDGERAALVISECQNNMINPEPGRRHLPGLADEAERRSLAANIARLAAGCRAADVPVLHCTIEPRPDFAGLGTRNPLLGTMAKRGSEPRAAFDRGYEIDPGIPVLAEDFRVPRQHGVTPFGGTSLVPLLRNLRIDTVLLTGVSTNVALPGSAVEAVNAGFAVVLVEDCTCGASPRTHEFMVREFFPLLGQVVTAAEVLAELGAPVAAPHAG
jgi:nicotinamidase-related amidase